MDAWKVSCMVLVAALAGCRQPAAPQVEQPVPAAEDRAAAKPWAPAIFSGTTQRADPTDVVLFFKAYGLKLAAAKKGEFETTAEFKARTSDRDALLAPISTKDWYLFVPERAELQYNADKERYEAVYLTSCFRSYPFSEGVSCRFGTDVESRTSFSGQNAYGASADVTSERGRDLYFLFPVRAFRRPGFKWHYNDYADLPVDCPVPLERARALQGQPVAVGYAISVRGDALVDGLMRTKTPTVSDPSQELFYSEGIPSVVQGTACFLVRTGEVLGYKQL